jgi:glutamate-ammonia-ligase adenylyltransferase
MPHAGRQVPAALRPALRAAGWYPAGEAAAAALLTELGRGPDPDGALTRLAAILAADPALGTRALTDPALGAVLVAVSGASSALARFAAAHPGALQRAVAVPGPLRGPIRLPRGDPGRVKAALSRAVGERLLSIAAADLTGRLDMPAVGAALSRAADQAAQAALRLLSGGSSLPFCVVAMGKWGGGELNYASDIDLLFVYGLPADGAADEAGEQAQRLAEAFLDLLGSADGIGYRVDAALRPEGRAGPLARTVESYHAYWKRWAQPWEMQALIKARPAAGDAALGRAFLEAAEPLVYPETLAPDALRSIRAMKGRTEARAARGPAGEIKRRQGGIRDVEFAVQLLQLVHGRADPGIRSGNTLEALCSLAAAGYVSPEDAEGLESAYRWLRDVEHRLQLVDLRRTHQVPEDPAPRDRIAKALGYRDGPAGTALEAFGADLVARRAAVRAIHERLFYRPLLEAFATSPATGLNPEGAARQLAALGFQDAAGARRAVDDLTAGLSRRSRLMQQLLPLMMGWLSESPDPDLGLEQLRLLVASSPDNAELVAAMRDNPVAAERLCTLLGTSRLLGQLLDRIPPALPRLGSDQALDAFPALPALAAEAGRRTAIRPGGEETAAALRRFLEVHLLWLACLDLLGRADQAQVGERLSDLADAAAAAALEAALSQQTGPAPPMAVMAMGTWGGRELGYASDLDALVVCGGERHAAAAQRVTEALLASLGPGGPLGSALALDLALRPEGKTGAVVRSLDAYAAYWDRWAEPWEGQALLRARLVAGDPVLGADFLQAARARACHPGFGAAAERAVRHLKARMERERIPAHEDPQFHTKLGRGSLSDVEWVVQFLQMRHGAAHPEVCTPGTLAGLAALRAAGLLSAPDATALDAAYRFCAAVRNRLFLQAGRRRDSLPTDPSEATHLARSMGYTGRPRTALREDYRRVTRRSRRVFERIFHGEVGPG